MRLTILGGGGFRVPLIYRALLADHEQGRVTHLTLHDLDPSRLTAISRVLHAQAAGIPTAPQITTTTDLTEALTGTDFVFVAIRVTGLHGRAIDERVALDEGVIGQETVGAGGISYGLRTLPVTTDIARRTAEIAPDAWVINFTNPAGMVTEAMSHHLGDRVIGICDEPVGLARRVLHALRAGPTTARLDYIGLNHLGWLRAVEIDGQDRLPALLADPTALGSIEEGRLFGTDWLQTLGAIPNPYLHYYYYNRESVAAARAATQTRGAFLLRQQHQFYASLDCDTAGTSAYSAWERTRHEREITYMAENRAAAGAGDRDTSDLEAGGYEAVALTLMRAIARNEQAHLILNVRNQGTLSELDNDAVIETPCLVDANGAHPHPTTALPGHAVGLVTTVKAVERAVIEAARTGSRAAALRAMAIHPLVDSVAVANRLLTTYQARLPELAYLQH